MKRILFALAAVISGFAAAAQTPPAGYSVNPYPKTITVSGSAEMEIIPDEIYVNIELREYQKKGEPKKDLETIKAHFLSACTGAGIPDSAISIAAYSGYNNYYNFKKTRKNNDMMATITYQVKFRNSKLMDDLVEKLDDEATQNFIIAGTNHSRMPDFRKQLKIKAVQAAKDKGIYLTEAIGEKLGEAITINEPDLPFQRYYSNSNMISNVQSRSFAGENERLDYSGNGKEVDFKKLKMRFEVTIVFALK